MVPSIPLLSSELSVSMKENPDRKKIGRGHGLPKIHRHVYTILNFKAIADTRNTTHYNVGKYAANLLNPLTQNDFTAKDFFGGVNRIQY